MNFDEIMREITSGLSHISEQDIPYLRGQMEKYKEHELSKEILRACGRLMYELLPDDKKDDLAKAIKNDGYAYETALDEVRFNVYKKDYDKALSIIEAVIKKAESLEAFQNDAVSEYYTFDEPFEEVAYKINNESEKTIRRAPLPFSTMYLLYGSLLFEMKRYDEAQAALRKSLKWNPTSAEANFEYIETFKVLGDFETFFSLSKDALNYVFRAVDVARCYRNIGFYFVEKGLYREATFCYLLSAEFERESKQVQSELYFISHRCKQDFGDPSMDDLKAIGEEYGFHVGPSDDVIDASYGIGKHCLEAKDYPLAKYFLSITYDLVHDAKIKEMLDGIPNAE